MARTWQIDTPTSATVEGGSAVRAVSVALVAGRIDVVSHDDARDVRYDVHAVEGRPLVASLDGTTFRLEQHRDPKGQWLETLKGFLSGYRNVSARVTLTVPTGTRVTVNTVSAEVLVGGVAGDVGVNTVSGTVGLTRLPGRVDVKTVNGEIDASGLSGELKAKTVSGRITVDDSALRSAKIAGVSGAILLDLAGTASLVTTNAVSGDTTIRVPEGAGYDVTVASSSGHVVVDGETLSGGLSGERGGHRSDGDRRFAVKARTVSGNVVVLRDRGDQAAGAFDRRERGGPTVGGADLTGDVQDVRPSDRRPEGDDPARGGLDG